MLALPSAAQEPGGAIVGQVVDRAAERPVAGVTVRLVDRSLATRAEGTAGPDGVFGFRFDSVPAAAHELAVEHLGYGAASAGVETRPGRTTHVRMEVAPDAVELPPVGVTLEHRTRYLENRGYYRRLEGHSGTFIGPEEMAEAPPAPGMKAFLDREVSGLTAKGPHLLSRRALGLPPSSERCKRAAVFVDGQWSWFGVTP